MVFYIIKMEINIMANLKMIKKMEKEYYVIITVINMKENIRMM